MSEVDRFHARCGTDLLEAEGGRSLCSPADSDLERTQALEADSWHRRHKEQVVGVKPLRALGVALLSCVWLSMRPRVSSTLGELPTILFAACNHHCHLKALDNNRTFPSTAFSALNRMPPPVSTCCGEPDHETAVPLSSTYLLAQKWLIIVMKLDIVCPLLSCLR